VKGNKWIQTPDDKFFDIIRDGKFYYIWADLEDGGTEMMVLDDEENEFTSEEDALEWLKKHHPDVEIKEE
jgi:hypothetical protein